MKTGNDCEAIQFQHFLSCGNLQVNREDPSHASFHLMLLLLFLNVMILLFVLVVIIPAIVAVAVTVEHCKNSSCSGSSSNR